MSLNTIALMGRLTKNPELRYTKAEQPVASFSIAVDRDGKDAGVDFIDIVAWDGKAKFAESYFHKGDPIVVRGRLQIRNWEDKNGNNRTSAEVVAEKLNFVLKPQQNAEISNYAAPGYSDIADADEGSLPF